MRRVSPAIWLSSRGIFALLGLALVCALASIAAWALPLAIAGAAAFVACTIADVALGPSVRSLRIVRREIGPLALGRAAEIVYDVENRTDRSVRVGIFEPPVATIAFARREARATAGPREGVAASLEIVPRERGPVHFGATFAWCESSLGLVRRRFRIAGDQDVRVFPDLTGVERYGTLAKRSTLVDFGLRKLRQRGVGTEFESLRDYQSGDGFRFVDWKATARRGRLTVAQYEVERSQNVVVAIDCGRLMTPRLDTARKFDYALTAALSVTRIAQRADDNVGLLAFAAKPILEIAPRRGAAHYAALARAAYDLQPRMEEPDYETIFTGLRRAHTKRSLVILFTDIFDPVTSAGVLAGIGTLVRRHVVVCVLMNDAAVARALTVTPATSDEAYRTSIAMSLSDERVKTIATLRAAGVIALDVPAAELSVRLIDAYLDVKARGLL
jgi:uncharacterized protein (DUF58 family)